MKLHAASSSLVYVLAGLLAPPAARAGPPDHVQPPPQARGRYVTFDAPVTGPGRIELFSGGPTITCDFNPGRGARNPRGCVDGATAVTVVDADCPESSLFHGNSNRKCFAASISEGTTGKVYHVNSAGEVNERDTADYPEEEHPPNEGHPDEGIPTDASRRLRGTHPAIALPKPSERLLQGTPVIDVLVIYTQGAKTDAQNYQDGPIVDLVNLAIAETNQAYANSGVNAELRLAGGAPHEDTSGYTADVGSTSMSPSLYHLTRTAGSSQDPDGLLDYVHQMRTDVGADMVALITTGAGCGIAWLSGHNVGSLPSKGSQFSVTKYSCATGYYSFGHELGHNMGCHHDKGTTNACLSTNGKYGYRGTNGQYRSILSYSCNTSQCDSNVGGPCTRSMFFSTPDPTKLWAGQPMGADADDTVTGITDNAAHITAVAAHIAGFNDPPVLYPSASPTTAQPTTAQPTNQPTTAQPTNQPTPSPTASPTVSAAPSKAPSKNPTKAPSPSPTGQPTFPPVAKYVCSNKDVLTLGETAICTDGALLGGDCPPGSDETTPCNGGNGGKRCRIASCPGTGPAPTPPSPTPEPNPTPTPPGPSPTPPSCGTGGHNEVCSANSDCLSCICNSGNGKCTKP